LCYAGEGDEWHSKVQIEHRDRDTEKKVHGRKAHESYISIWVENIVSFVQLRTIVVCTNVQTSVNTRDDFQEDWRNSSISERGRGRNKRPITPVVFYYHKSIDLSEKR